GLLALTADGIHRAACTFRQLPEALPAHGGPIWVRRRGQNMSHHHEVHLEFAGRLALFFVVYGSRHQSRLWWYRAAQQYVGAAQVHAVRLSPPGFRMDGIYQTTSPRLMAAL